MPSLRILEIQFNNLESLYFLMEYFSGCCVLEQIKLNDNSFYNEKYSQTQDFYQLCLSAKFHNLLLIND